VRSIVFEMKGIEREYHYGSDIRQTEKVIEMIAVRWMEGGR
jgi:hypothetical protein